MYLSCNRKTALLNFLFHISILSIINDKQQSAFSSGVRLSLGPNNPIAVNLKYKKIIMIYITGSMCSNHICSIFYNYYETTSYLTSVLTEIFICINAKCWQSMLRTMTNNHLK